MEAKVTKKFNPEQHLNCIEREHLEDIGLMMFERSIQFPVLIERVNRLENQLASCQNELRIANDKIRKFEEVDLRIKAAKAMVVHGN